MLIAFSRLSGTLLFLVRQIKIAPNILRFLFNQYLSIIDNSGSRFLPIEQNVQCYLGQNSHAAFNIEHEDSELVLHIVL